jgi:hypothetical protein
MLIGRVRRLRLATRAVTVIQFAAVTFIPAVHPYLHDRPAVGAPTAGPIHTAEHPRHIRDECPICSVHPGSPLPAASGLAPWPGLTSTPPLGPSEADLRCAPPGPANRVRAPPQL